MKEVFLFRDTANEQVGFIILERGESITYYRWDSPWSWRFQFGEFDETNKETDKRAVRDWSEEILEGGGDYSTYIKIGEGPDWRKNFFKGIFLAAKIGPEQK